MNETIFWRQTAEEGYFCQELTSPLHLEAAEVEHRKKYKRLRDWGRRREDMLWRERKGEDGIGEETGKGKEKRGEVRKGEERRRGERRGK